MGRKETEEAIADSRAGRVTRVGSVAELLAELNADDTPDVGVGGATEQKVHLSSVAAPQTLATSG